MSDNNSILKMDILPDNSIDMAYNISSLPIYVQREQLCDFPVMKTPPHWNTGLEMVHIIEGEMSIYINGERYDVAKGDICSITTGCVHYFVSIDMNNCIYDCYVVEESIFTSSAEVSERYIRPLFHSAYPAFSIIKADNDITATDYLNTTPAARLDIILSQINRTANEQTGAYALHIIAMFHECISILYDSLTLSAGISSAKTRQDDSMRRMLSYIHENYALRISSDDLCEIGQISHSQLFNLFKKYTGDTPADFILRYRLHIARKLLITGTTPIAQIAIECGFTHQSHFTAHFIRHYGVTPLNCRKNRGC